MMLPFPPYRWLPLLLSSLFGAVDRVLSSGCYYAYNSTILPSPGYVDPCGTVTSTNAPFLNCCALQANNVCLSNSICYDPNRVGGAYYLSPCTDRSYSAPECPQYCRNRVDKNQLDITYDSGNDIWRCCSTSDDGSSSDCSHPTDESFAAPAPGRLSTIYPSPSSNPTTPPSSTPTTPPSSTPTTPPSSNPTTLPSSSSSASLFQSHSNVTSSAPRSSSLGTDDIIALSVGVPGTIATIVGVVFAYKTWQRKSKRSQHVASRAQGRRP